jgi:geranylgeranyl transferase type-2 subunit beta
LTDFILKCQGFDTYCIPCGDRAGGGIADRPGNMVDIFHTFFGICGLSLLGYFKGTHLEAEGVVIEPTYALPKSLVEKLGLPAQTLSSVGF